MMQANITTKFDSRIAVLEQMQEQKALGYTQLLEGYEKQQNETNNLFMTKTMNYVDKQDLETLKKCHDHMNESVVNHRKDFEGMVKRMGANIQEALSKIQSQIKQDIEFSSADLEQKLENIRSELSQESESMMNEALGHMNETK